jgi:hypothetical protein
MHHALVVGVLEAGRQFLQELELAGEGQRDVLLDMFGERGPFDVLHDDEGRAFVFAEIVDRDDVGVFQAAGRLGLAQEAVVEILVADPQQLDRDGPPDMGVMAAEDHAHPAVTDTVDDLVAADSPRNMRCRH